MTKSKRFVMKDPNDWGYPITDTDTGKVYSCASNIWMKELCTDINKIVDENEQLKKELVEFKKWEKHIGNVKREELDRIFKMSIYEIAEAFDYYEERIEKLERSCKND